MAITNHERVGKALELLKSGPGPFVERELKNAYQARAEAQATVFMGEDRLLAKNLLQIGIRRRCSSSCGNRGTRSFGERSDHRNAAS